MKITKIVMSKCQTELIDWVVGMGLTAFQLKDVVAWKFPQARSLGLGKSQVRRAFAQAYRTYVSPLYKKKIIYRVDRGFYVINTNAFEGLDRLRDSFGCRFAYKNRPLSHEQLRQYQSISTSMNTRIEDDLTQIIKEAGAEQPSAVFSI